jgi:hypothetical protein
MVERLDGQTYSYTDRSIEKCRAAGHLLKPIHVDGHDGLACGLCGFWEEVSVVEKIDLDGLDALYETVNLGTCHAVTGMYCGTLPIAATIACEFYVVAERCGGKEGARALLFASLHNAYPALRDRIRELETRLIRYEPLDATEAEAKRKAEKERLAKILKRYKDMERQRDTFISGLHPEPAP